MRRQTRLIGVLFALLLPGVALARFVYGGAATDLRESLHTLPRSFGPWQAGRERALTPEEAQLLEPHEYVRRNYEAPGRSPIWVYAALYTEQTSYGRGAHDPAVCYPAQGWEILSTRSIRVDLPDGDALIATLFLAHFGNVEQQVLYWFQPAERWPREPLSEQLLRIWDGLMGRPQYGFVRLAATVTPGIDAERDLLDFARRVAWPVRTVLSPDPPPGKREVAGK